MKEQKLVSVYLNLYSQLPIISQRLIEISCAPCYEMLGVHL
jgi:hypothetical protein